MSAEIKSRRKIYKFVKAKVDHCTVGLSLENEKTTAICHVCFSH